MSLPRYVSVANTRPAAEFDECRFYDTRGSIDVIVDALPDSVETGLLDVNGNPIRRMVERNPVGFRVAR